MLNDDDDYLAFIWRTFYEVRKNYMVTEKNRHFIKESFRSADGLFSDERQITITRSQGSSLACFSLG